MAQKKFKQQFASEFLGIDGESTALDVDSGGVNRVVNYEQAIGNSLRGRVGMQVAGAQGLFFAIANHSYSRTQNQYDAVYDNAGSQSSVETVADGASINRVVTTNAQTWYRDTINIPVTVSGTVNASWYTYVNGSAINFVIKDAGVAKIDTSLGNGLNPPGAPGPGTSTRIWDLLTTINGFAGPPTYGVNIRARGTCPPFAVATGAVSTFISSAPLGEVWRIFTSGVPADLHNFAPGDPIVFNSQALFRAGLVVAINVGGTNSVDVLRSGGYQPVANEVLGYLGQPAAGFDIDVAQSSTTSPITLSFPVWKPIFIGDNATFGSEFQVQQASWGQKNTPTGAFYSPDLTPPSFVNAQGNLYSALPSDRVGSKLYKNDGLCVSKAGLPAPTCAVSETAVGAFTVGQVRKYKAFFRRVDAQGNIVDGPLSNIVTWTTAAATAFNNVTITGLSYASGTGYQVRSAFKVSNQSPINSGTSITVDDSAGGYHYFQIGDPVYFTDNVAQKVGLGINTLQKARCTFVGGTTGNTIRTTYNGGGQINDNSHMTAGLTVVVLRTTNQNNAYYVLGEAPISGLSSTGLTFTDNVTDAVLAAGEQFEEPELGKEHDAPPDCSLVCAHQGGLVVAGGVAAPNTVSFSTVAGIEYFPLASNSLDIPSGVSSRITAIVSDTNDRLAVFKETAYYDVQGDLDAGAFSVNVRNEGDYGIPSQASLVRVRQTLIGLSQLGFITIRDGELDPFRFKDLNTRIIDSGARFKQATAVNDLQNRSYICALPSANGTATFVIDYSRQNVKTFERQYSTSMDPSNGMVMSNGTLYQLSETGASAVMRRLRRFSAANPSPHIGNGDSFIDNTLPISYYFESNPISLDEPDVLKTAVRFRLWSTPNDNVFDGWVPFSAIVYGSPTPIASLLIGSPQSTSSTVTFATTSDIFKDVKLKPMKAPFYLVGFATEALRESPFISGYEIMYAENYTKEDLIK